MATRNKLLDVLRWLSFLPVAALGAWLAWYVANILGRFSLGYVGIENDDILAKIHFMAVGHSAMGAAFVYIGAMIAPYQKVTVAFILGGIGIIVAGFLIFPAVVVREWWAAFGGLFVALGAGAVVYFVHKGEIYIK